MATANARGERLKYCTERSSLVFTTNPRFQVLAIDWTLSLQSPKAAASYGMPSTERPAALPPL